MRGSDSNSYSWAWTRSLFFICLEAGLTWTRVFFLNADSNRHWLGLEEDWRRTEDRSSKDELGEVRARAEAAKRNYGMNREVQVRLGDVLNYGVGLWEWNEIKSNIAQILILL